MALFISCVDGFVPWVGGGKEDLGPSFKLSTQEYKVGGTLGVISSREGFGVSPLYLGFRSSFSPFFLSGVYRVGGSWTCLKQGGRNGGEKALYSGSDEVGLISGLQKGGRWPLT